MNKFFSEIGARVDEVDNEMRVHVSAGDWCLGMAPEDGLSFDVE